MAIRDVFKISRKTFFNPVNWLDIPSLKSQNRTMFDVMRGLFTPAKGAQPETFEEAMQRLNLSEADIMSTMAAYRRYAWLFFALGTISLLYAFHLLVNHFTWSGFLLGIGAAALFLSQAFKYDFWRFQMQQRKLGLTIADWRQHLFQRSKG